MRQIRLNVSEHEGADSASAAAGLAVWRQAISVRLLADLCRLADDVGDSPGPGSNTTGDPGGGNG